MEETGMGQLFLAIFFGLLFLGPSRAEQLIMRCDDGDGPQYNSYSLVIDTTEKVGVYSSPTATNPFRVLFVSRDEISGLMPSGDVPFTLKLGNHPRMVIKARSGRTLVDPCH
jgi:hypothetical protein